MPGPAMQHDERHVARCAWRPGRDQSAFAVADQADPPRVDVLARLEELDAGQHVARQIGGGGVVEIARRSAHAAIVARAARRCRGE